MTAILLPEGKQSFTTAAGLPLVGGKVFTWDAGTSNPRLTWADAAQTAPNADPIILDARGEAVIFWSGAYRVQLQDSTGAIIWTVDAISTQFAAAASFIPSPTNTFDLGSSTFTWRNIYLGSSGLPAVDTNGNVGLWVRTGAEIAVGVTPVNNTYDRQYIERQGAPSGNIVDALTAVNSAILSNARQIRSYDGDFKVTAAPTNPNGIEFQGTGSLLLPTAFAFPRQLNTYSDLNKYMIGREYLYRVDLRLSISAPTSSSPLGVFLFGDSTIEGGAVTAPYLLQNLLPVLIHHKGIAVQANITNRGVSGTKVTDWNPLPDLSTSTDFYIVKYGINDGLNPAGTRLATFASSLRAKLAAIRAATNGDLPHLAILLVGPNATASDTDGRNEQWYEQLRGVYVQAARDYNCAYFDTYAFLKDSRPAASLWMDANTVGGQANVPIHPQNTMQMWIWGAIVDFIFPDTAMDPYRGNFLQNLPSADKRIVFSALSTAYDYGITISRALVADSWPVDGSLMTVRQVDGPALQTLFPSGPGTQIYTRQGNNAAWGIWFSEDTVTPALLSSWVAFAAGQDIKAIKGGKIVAVNGLIKNGTTTNGTTLCVLPAGFRPRTTYWFTCPTSGPATAQISVDPSGNVVGQAGLNATFTAVACSFEAAN